MVPWSGGVMDEHPFGLHGACTSCPWSQRATSVVSYPSSHVGWQTSPCFSVVGQLPDWPCIGEVIVHD